MNHLLLNLGYCFLDICDLCQCHERTEILEKNVLPAQAFKMGVDTHLHGKKSFCLYLGDTFLR